MKIAPAALIVLLLANGTAAQTNQAAATQPPAGTPAASPVQTAPPSDDQRDLVDLFRQWRKKDAGKKPEAVAEEQAKGTAFIVIPVIASKPASGVSFGVGGTIERPLGSTSDTFVSSWLFGASVTTKKQYTLFAKPEVYGPGNAWLVAGDNHYKLGGQTTYGLGSGTTAENGVDATYKSTKFIDTYYREPVDHLLVGAGLSYQRFSDVTPDGVESWTGTPYEQYSLAMGFDLAQQTAAGLLASVRFDSRDMRSDPFRGWFAETRYTANMAGFLGGDSTWQRLYVDVRHYVPIENSRRQVVALWAYGDFVTHGNAPYLSLPATGTDLLERSGRGYAEGRFRGDKLIYGEVEYRLTLRRDGLLGMVAFLNATTVGSAFASQSLFDSVAIGGGVGFRARLQKRSRTNFCIDVGFGREGSHGFYMGIAEAF